MDRRKYIMRANMIIMNMNKLNEKQLVQAAIILHEELSVGYPTLADAKNEISERLKEEDSYFIAGVIENEVIGWCSILSQYNGNVFELHPLVVSKEHQRKGYGTILVKEIISIAKKKGG